MYQVRWAAAAIAALFLFCVTPVVHAQTDCESFAGCCDGLACDGACGNEACKKPWFNLTCDTLLENLSLFGGLEGSKQPQDFGVNALFGGRFHANMGLPVVASHGVGVQIGTALNFTDNAVQVFERVDGTKDRVQSFTTLGVFQRLDCGFSWGLAYDYLYQRYYDDFSLGQVRADVGMKINDFNEIGIWAAFAGQSNDGAYATIPLTLDPIAQGSLYFRHEWENDAQTTVWLGIAEGHGEVNVALGDLPPTGNRLVFGSDVFIPISPALAIFGQANFITPSDTGTVDAFLGVAFYPGGSHGARDRTFAPRLSVANNTTFANDLKR